MAQRLLPPTRAPPVAPLPLTVLTVLIAVTVLIAPIVLVVDRGCGWW